MLRESQAGSGGRGRTLAAAVPFRLAGTKALAASRATITRDAFRVETRVAATSLLVPPEVCWAAGFMPFNWEMYASLLSTHTRVAELSNRGSEETPRCSFFDTLKGAFLERVLPRPDVAISSSAYCSGIGFLFEEVARGFDTPHLHVDIPTYGTSSATDYLAVQLREVFRSLCRLSGIGLTRGEARLRKALRLSALARQAYADLCELRQRPSGLDLSLEPLHWHFLFFALWGTEEGLEVCHQLRDEVAALAAEPGIGSSDRLPIAVFGLYPYGRTDLWGKLLESGVYSAFEGLNWLGSVPPPCAPQSDRRSPQDLFLGLAESLIASPMRGGQVQLQADEVIGVVRRFGAEGLLVFSHDQCQMIGQRLGPVEGAASSAGMPFCVLNGDCLLGVPAGPASLRLGTFLTSLRRPGPTASANPHRRMSTGPAADLRVGVDFGSGFSKYVVVDRDQQIVKHGLFSSGIDYPGLLDEMLSAIQTDRSCALAVTGVGSDNPALQDRVHLQTTEIVALTAAVRALYPNEESLVVVDVGSQDIKVLRFDSMAEEPWCNTNKSCGAGTGCVLTQILERWQQSEPDMTFERLDRLALEADKAEAINTTCGIFAVTHVVSALIQADQTRRREILRGVYAYIASQATRHFPPGSRTGARLLVVGGLARHETLRLTLVEEGFHLLELPSQLDPQLVVAFGAALALGEAPGGLPSYGLPSSVSHSASFATVG